MDCRKLNYKLSKIKSLLTILIILAITPRAYSQTKEEKEKILEKLIQGAECKELLDNCQEYQNIQSSVINTLEEKNKSLTFGFNEVKLYNDSLFNDKYNLQLNLNKSEERSYRKTNALIIVISIALIEGFIITQK